MERNLPRPVTTVVQEYTLGAKVVLSVNVPYLMKGNVIICKKQLPERVPQMSWLNSSTK